MHLLIDWGNTQLKYLLVKKLSDLREGTDVQVADSITSCLAICETKINGQNIKNVLIASVRSDQDNQQLKRQLNELGWNYYFATSSTKACGVQCAYQNPARLGVDRWLTIISANENNRNTGIIDIGTAIKLDIVDGEGRHLGGHILPGKKMMQTSLLNTARVRATQEVVVTEEFSLGKSTEECVEFGIEQLISGYLVNSIKQATKQYQIDLWLLTGGGSEYWHKQIKNQLDNFTSGLLLLKPLLVFDGLVKLYSENEVRRHK